MPLSLTLKTIKMLFVEYILPLQTLFFNFKIQTLYVFIRKFHETLTMVNSSRTVVNPPTASWVPRAPHWVNCSHVCWSPVGGSSCPLHPSRNFPGEPHQPAPQPHILEKPGVFHTNLEWPAAPACDSAFASGPRVPRKQAGGPCARSAASRRATQRPTQRPAIWLAAACTALFPTPPLGRLILTRSFRSCLPGSI